MVGVVFFLCIGRFLIHRLVPPDTVDLDGQVAGAGRSSAVRDEGLRRGYPSLEVIAVLVA
jgi:hypothetical protein